MPGVMGIEFHDPGIQMNLLQLVGRLDPFLFFEPPDEHANVVVVPPHSQRAEFQHALMLGKEIPEIGERRCHGYFPGLLRA